MNSSECKLRLKYRCICMCVCVCVCIDMIPWIFFISLYHFTLVGFVSLAGIRRLESSTGTAVPPINTVLATQHFMSEAAVCLCTFSLAEYLYSVLDQQIISIEMDSYPFVTFLVCFSFSFPSCIQQTFSLTNFAVLLWAMPLRDCDWMYQKEALIYNALLLCTILFFWAGGVHRVICFM